METLKILKINGFFVNKLVKDLANKNRCVVSTKIQIKILDEKL